LVESRRGIQAREGEDEMRWSSMYGHDVPGAVTSELAFG
jgi:hypothetical protein